MGDAKASRERIFAAATSEFAGHGIAGARIDRIAQSAGVNKQLIYAYFGNKRSLFDAVLAQAAEHVASSVGAELVDLDSWVDAHIDYHREYPEYMRLLLWEALETDAESGRRSEARARLYAEKTAQFALAQGRGLVRPELPPAHAVMFMMAVINYPAVMPVLRELLFGDDADADQVRVWAKDAIRHMVGC